MPETTQPVGFLLLSSRPGAEDVLLAIDTIESIRDVGPGLVIVTRTGQKLLVRDELTDVLARIEKAAQE